jgi:phosphatidylglycerophosphate synthase
MYVLHPRILMCPQKAYCATIYGVSCFTDFLDGYLARLWGVSSAFGAFIDPVADKVTNHTHMTHSANFKVLYSCQLLQPW